MFGQAAIPTGLALEPMYWVMHVANWGESASSSGNWISRGTQSTTVNYSLYALSETLTVPVPEPETWAMLLAGLGLVGAAVRRRKQAEA